MEWLKCFSDDYANAVTAFAALGTLVLALVTLLYLKREYSAKFQPYVVPVVHAEPIPDALGCVLSIQPCNIGSHPCKAKILDTKLRIGDEEHGTPDDQDWLLLAPSGIGVIKPAGHVNQLGVTKIREGRYRSNRIELTFKLETASTVGSFSESKNYAYEINVLGEKPQALFRPEWISST